MPIYKINDHDINVIEAGHPNRQVAILIHGWSSSWYAMSPILGLLSQRFRCLAVDLPGYGKSPKLKKDTTITDYADLIAGLIEEVSDGPVVLIGHSMGGMISIQVAKNYPVLVERMVLICPTITGLLSTFINLVVSPITFLERFPFGQLLSSGVQNIVVGITDRIMRPVSFAERTGITQEDYARIRADARRPDQGKVRAECFLAKRESDLSGSLHRLDIPSLVLWGAEDNTVPLRDAGVVADEWPDADLRILPKAGHWPHFERPEATLRLIASFLGLSFSRNKLYEPVEDDELQQIRETAQFFAHSDVGNNLNVTQRTRLAAQCQRRIYNPHDLIVHVRDQGNEMYIIYDGTVDVWTDPSGDGENTKRFRKMATLRPGQITGELALFDEGLRSANLVAGDSGATMLVLNREQVLALADDDPTLGAKFLWNMARALSNRIRFIQWQNRRIRQKDATGAFPLSVITEVTKNLNDHVSGD